MKIEYLKTVMTEDEIFDAVYSHYNTIVTHSHPDDRDIEICLFLGILERND